jgi:hypothetical protein
VAQRSSGAEEVPTPGSFAFDPKGDSKLRLRATLIHIK